MKKKKDTSKFSVNINSSGFSEMISLFKEARANDPEEIPVGNADDSDSAIIDPSIDKSNNSNEIDLIKVFDERKRAVNELLKKAPSDIHKQKQFILKLRQEEKKMLSDRITDIIRVTLNIAPARKGNHGYVRGKITDNATGLWMKFPNEITARAAVAILHKYNYQATQIGNEINSSLINNPEKVVEEGTSLLENIDRLRQEEREILEKVSLLKDKVIGDSQLTESQLLEKMWDRIIEFNCGIMDLRAKIIVKSDGSFSFPTIDKSTWMLLMENISVGDIKN
jgi:hypothetical protein